MDLPFIDQDIDTDQAMNLLILIAALIIAFGLGMNWETYMQNHNYPALFLYTGVMVFATIHFYREL